MSHDAPEGFQPHTRHSPLTRPWEPIFVQTTEAAVILGLRLAEPHTNSRGFAHGGLIAAIADNAMGLSCGLRFSGPNALVTINLTVDYLGTARIGQWLAFETVFVKATSSMAFASLIVTADGEACAKASSTFRNMAPKANPTNPA